MQCRQSKPSVTPGQRYYYLRTEPDLSFSDRRPVSYKKFTSHEPRSKSLNRLLPCGRTGELHIKLLQRKSHAQKRISPEHRRERVRHASFPRIFGFCRRKAASAHPLPVSSRCPRQSRSAPPSGPIKPTSRQAHSNQGRQRPVARSGHTPVVAATREMCRRATSCPKSPLCTGTRMPHCRPPEHEDTGMLLGSVVEGWGSATTGGIHLVSYTADL